MAYAVEVECLQLRGVNHVANRDFGRRLGEDIASAGPAGARDYTRPPQPEQDLLDVITRQALDTRDFTAVDGPDLRSLRQMERANHSILGPGRYSHGFRIDIERTWDKLGSQFLFLTATDEEATSSSVASFLRLPGRHPAMRPSGHSDLRHLTHIENIVDLRVR